MRRPGRIAIIVGVATLVISLIAGRTINLYTEALWFREVGYSSTFWTWMITGWTTRVVAALVASTIALANLAVLFKKFGAIHLRREYGNLEIVERVPTKWVVTGAVLIALTAGWWLAGITFSGQNAISVLAWIRQVPWGIEDPLFGKDLSFFVFSLPIAFRIIDFLLLSLVWSTILVSIAHLLTGGIVWRENRLEIDHHVRLHLAVLLALVVLLLGIRYWLGRYGILLEGNGIGGGVGYTDIRARLPARSSLAFLALISAAALVFGAWYRSWTAPAAGMALLGISALFVGRVYPALIQKFRVEPNQFSMEAPYIGWNLDFTRRAYGLHRLRREPFPYQRDAIPRWQAVAPTLEKLPLWDEDILEHVYNQVEPVYAYYGFTGVDYDRYGEGRDRQQVAIAAREFNLHELPPSARTWQSLRLNPKYIKGKGAVISPAALATPGGEPLRWLRNIDPVVLDPAAPPELALVEPGIYFGELIGQEGSGQEFVILNPELDSTLHYSSWGSAPGILLDSYPRLLAFAWRFKDKNLLFSGELSEDSRLIFRRSLRSRLEAIAPFVLWDNDPHPVIEEGRVIWLINGYMATSTFPLSRSLALRGSQRVRYLQNSVVATIDAVTGETRLYAADLDDPILETYRRAFPGMIDDLSLMPASLRDHLRYPILYLRAQAEILKEYHLDRREAFFAGQDFWELPGSEDEALGRFRPLYTMMALPGEDEPEFLLSTPFLARGRQNMTALLIARNDPPHYGELVLYELPRDQQILGPVQVAALMEQDPAISPQLALWSQRGTVVRLGQVRTIPLDSSFLFLRPVFLSAREASIPELARLIVSDGRRVRMAPDLASAIEALTDSTTPTSRRTAPGGEDGGIPSLERGADPLEAELWRERALDLLEEAESRLRSGDWAGFGALLTELRAFLRGDPGIGELPSRGSEPIEGGRIPTR